MIVDTITQKIGEAMKAHDEVRLSTLRMLSSALNYEFIAKQHKLTTDEELAVVRHEAKKRKEAIEGLHLAQTKLVGREEDLKSHLEKEQKELEILQEFLPPEMPESELIKLVEATISETGALEIKDMGRVIGLVKQKSLGRADGAKTAQLVKEKLVVRKE